MRKNRFARITFLILSVFLMVLIFFFSQQAGAESSKTSSAVWRVLERILSVFLPQDSVEFLSGYIRKFAHVFIYFCLSLTVSAFVATFRFERRSLYFLLPVAFCLLYACSDEFHQYFIPGRAGVFTDVLIDGIGFVVGAAIINLINLTVRKKELK